METSLPTKNSPQSVSPVGRYRGRPIHHRASWTDMGMVSPDDNQTNKLRQACPPQAIIL
jgi:hypothetical protein